MSSSHKSDEYNLSQKSQSGKAGFESFKGEDDRYYFHFNDESGVAMLFSQAYKKPAERDVGIKSIQKNAPIKARFELLQEGDKHYFVLRAGNKFAIGRSRFFKNKAEMEAKRQFLTHFFTSEPLVKGVIAEASNANANTILASSQPSKEAVSSFKNAENEDLQRRVKELEQQIEQIEKSKADVSDIEKTEMPRQVFRIEMYKNDTSKRFHGKIIHPLTTDTRAFSGIDSHTIEQFIQEKINLKIEKTVAPQAKVAGEMSETSDNVSSSEVPRAAPVEKKVKTALSGKAVIMAHNPFNGSGSIEQESPFELTLKPQLAAGENLLNGTSYLMKIYVFSFATREHFVLFERTVAYNDNGTNILKTIVHQNALPKGSHRLTVIISEPNSTVDPALKYFEGTTWYGEVIIQVH